MAPQGSANIAQLAAAIEDPETVRDLGCELLEQISILDAKIGKLDAEVRKRAKESDEAKRLMTIPGIGPVCAMAIQAFAPPMEGFRRGTDDPWLAALMSRKPPMLAAATLANKMARMVRAVATTKECYRAPASA